MTAAQKLSLVTDESEALGDESGPAMEAMDAELMFQLRTSITIAKMDKRIVALENIVNKITTRWAVLGLPKLSEDV